MKFRTLLYAGFGIMIIVMILILSIVINMLNNQSKQMDELVQDRYEKIKLATSIQSDVSGIGQEISKITFEEITTSESQKMLKDVEKRFVEITNSLHLLEKNSALKESDLLIAQISDQIQQYRDTVNPIINHDKVRNNLDRENQLSNELAKNVDQLISIQENFMEDTIADSNKTYDRALLVTFFSTVCAVTLGLIMAFLVIRTITNRLTVIRKVMEEIVKGSDVYPRLVAKYDDELGAIATTYNEMAQALEKYEAAEKENLKRMEDQSWLKTKLADLASMSQGLLELRGFSDRFIRAVCHMTDAGFGILYIKETVGNEQYLKRLASFAASSTDSIGAGKIQIGEGLVGQCAADQQKIILNQVPDQYIQIRSGLGETAPSSIVIFPVVYEGEVLAVLELASLQSFSKMHHELLKQTAEQLGITLNRIQRHQQVQELLEQSQTLNEELQTQAEELQTQQEELRTMNDELEAQYLNSEQKTKEVEEIKNALEVKNQEIILSSKYKSEFLANMSHELRTPLNSLIILAQMLLENKEGNLDSKQVEYASTIYSSGNDLLKLINEILDLSKIESGKMEVHQGEVVLSDLLTFTKRQFMPIAKKKDLQFNITINEQVPNILYTDEQRLYQIIKNLLSNAFKFTNHGQIQLQIGLCERKVPDRKDTLNHFITFSIIDTGIGIPKDKTEFVFDAFHQADGTTSRKYGGTGLGLSISRELSGLLKGFIEVESVEGEGSVFTLYLPVDEEVDRTVTSYQQEVAASLDEVHNLTESTQFIQRSTQIKESIKGEGVNTLSGKKVLIVDDDMRNIFALTSALEDANMEAVFSENGKEALGMLSENDDIDIILMDIMMPEMDGYEAMQCIRQMPEYHNIPIIALTAKAMKNDRQKCIDAGASDYISKPVNLEQLFSLLQVWLHK